MAEPGGEWDAPINWCIGRDTEPPQAWLRVLASDREVARPKGWEDRERTERNFQAAERDRLLYVAATRAADLLVISEGPSEGRSPWAKLAAKTERLLPVLPERSRSSASVASLPDLSGELTCDFSI